MYTDFLRIGLEILNSVLTSALPANPDMVYALLHKQEVFKVGIIIRLDFFYRFLC